MSGAADDSTTKFPISGKVPLEWLMHRSASPSPGHAQSVGVFVTPGRPTTRGFGLVDARSRWLCATCLDNVTPNTGSPCVATVQLGGVSRPSNVRASARSMSQWVCSLLGFFIVPSGCGVPSLIVSSAPRSNLSFVWVVERWVWMLLLVRNGHVSGEMVVCVGRLRASCIELSSRTPLQCPPLVAVVPKGSLQLLVFNEEFLVSASHQLALTTSLPFVHTARRSYRLNGPVKCSDRGDVAGPLPATSREVH
ncbi:hypothetical protein V6N13_019518 [Hibiscus sabdariffa]